MSSQQAVLTPAVVAVCSLRLQLQEASVSLRHVEAAERQAKARAESAGEELAVLKVRRRATPGVRFFPLSLIPLPSFPSTHRTLLVLLHVVGGIRYALLTHAALLRPDDRLSWLPHRRTAPRRMRCRSNSPTPMPKCLS